MKKKTSIKNLHGHTNRIRQERRKATESETKRKKTVKSAETAKDQLL